MSVNTANVHSFSFRDNIVIIQFNDGTPTLYIPWKGFTKLEIV